LKKDPTPLIDAIYEELTGRGIPISDTKKFYEDMEKAFRVASKIADKIVIMDKDPRTIETAARIMAGHVEDPVSKLKELGIDLTPELEELKRVFAEISGKKIEPQKQRQVAGVSKLSEELARAKLEVLSILNGIEFAGYTEEAKRKAVGKLSSRIAELSKEKPTEKVLLHLGLYTYAIEAIKREKLERLKEL